MTLVQFDINLMPMATSNERRTLTILGISGMKQGLGGRAGHMPTLSLSLILVWIVYCARARVSFYSFGSIQSLIIILLA